MAFISTNMTQILGEKFKMALNRNRGNTSDFSRKESQSSLKVPQTINLVKLLVNEIKSSEKSENLASMILLIIQVI